MNYRIYSPGGNDTALVIGDDYDDYKGINDELMAKHPNVEQVGFLSTTEYRLTMAGGEFCGNASRAACFYYLDGSPGEIVLKTCGPDVPCGILEDGRVWLELPCPSPRKIDDGIYAVKLDGIIHIVITPDAPPAIGMIVADKREREYGGGFGIDPYVYVRNLHTFIHETACLSGSVAAAAVGGATRVTQPSGSVIDAEFINDIIRVSGSVTRLK